MLTTKTVNVARFLRSVRRLKSNDITSSLPLNFTLMPRSLSSFSIENRRQNRLLSLQVRLCSSNKRDDDDDPKNNEKDKEKKEEVEATNDKKEESMESTSKDDGDIGSEKGGTLHQTILPAAVTIPEEWPQMPVIAIARNPVFPRFIKIIEVTEVRLMELIRKKVRQAQPYVGVFLKRDETCDKEVVSSIQDLHNVGTFCNIVELQDLGDKLRMIVMAHRRVRIIGQVVLDEEVEEDVHPETDKQKRRRKRREKKEKNGNNDGLTTSAVDDNNKEEIVNNDESKAFTPVPVLLIEAENVKHVKFAMTTEVKALVQEIVRTIRDIIQMNPLYRESVQSVLVHGERVVEDPVYLCDLGAAITGSDNEEFQAVLEEMNITKRLMVTLSMLKKELELNRLQQKIGREVEEKVKQQHRKYMLHEQLKAIKKELGIEKDDKDTIEEKFRARLKEKTVPKPIMDVIDEEITKLRTLDSHASEFK